MLPNSDPEEDLRRAWPYEDEEDDEEERCTCWVRLSVYLLLLNPCSLGWDTKAFENDENAPTPRPLRSGSPLPQKCLRRARRVFRLSHDYLHPSPLTTSPTDAGAPLGYRAAGIRMRAVVASPPSLLPPTSPRTDVPEAEMPPRKRACLTTPASGYEIRGLSSRLEPQDCRYPARVTELDTTVRQRTKEFEIRFEEAHDDRAYLGALVNTLYRDRLHYCRTALAMDREAVNCSYSIDSSEERSAAIVAHVRSWSTGCHVDYSDHITSARLTQRLDVLRHRGRDRAPG
ncbi:hypothetical protein Tco_1146024 [Tanacetum coccineum]